MCDRQTNKTEEQRDGETERRRQGANVTRGVSFQMIRLEGWYKNGDFEETREERRQTARNTGPSHAGMST